MSDRSSDRIYGPARQYVPDVIPLEGRCLLSRTICFPDGHCFIIPNPTFPRTGGVAVQTGAALSIGVAAKPAASTLQITDDGAGNIQTQWDGGPVHSFSGVQAISAEVKGPRSDQVTLNLTGPLTEPLHVSITLHGKTNTIIRNESGHGPAVPVLIDHVVGKGHLTVR